MITKDDLPRFQSYFDTCLATVRGRDYTRAGEFDVIETGEVVDFNCAYSDSKGNACHIGALLPEDVRVSLGNSQLGASGLEAHKDWPLFPEQLRKDLTANTEFFGVLQNIHDTSAHVKNDYERKMDKFAASYSLEYTAP